MLPDDDRLTIGALVFAGHLPQKQQDYRKKFRTLASTYLTFSPDGNELLVNLGGEQIYLFDINRPHQVQKYDLLQMLHSNGVVKGEYHYSTTAVFSQQWLDDIKKKFAG